MIIQPRGYKRQPTYSNLLLEIRRRLDAIAAYNDVSRSFVITTLLARQLGINKKEADYESALPNRKRNHARGHHEKIRRIK